MIYYLFALSAVLNPIQCLRQVRIGAPRTAREYYVSSGSTDRIEPAEWPAPTSREAFPPPYSPKPQLELVESISQPVPDNTFLSEEYFRTEKVRTSTISAKYVPTEVNAFLRRGLSRFVASSEERIPKNGRLYVVREFEEKKPYMEEKSKDSEVKKMKSQDLVLETTTIKVEENLSVQKNEETVSWAITEEAFNNSTTTAKPTKRKLKKRRRKLRRKKAQHSKILQLNAESSTSETPSNTQASTAPTSQPKTTQITTEIPVVSESTTTIPYLKKKARIKKRVIQPYQTQIQQYYVPAVAPQENYIEMPAIVDKESNVEYSKANLVAMCAETRKMGSSWGISDIADFASRNCVLIRMYYPNVSCSQINQFVDYCNEKHLFH